MTSIAASDPVDACLALEHEALWTFAYVGARTSGATQRQAEESYAAHRRVRDALLSLLHARGVDPAAPQTAYDVPGVTSNAGGRAAAQPFEDRLAQAWLAVFERSPDDRALAQRRLTAAARAGVAWGAPPTAFPGRS